MNRVDFEEKLFRMCSKLEYMEQTDAFSTDTRRYKNLVARENLEFIRLYATDYVANYNLVKVQEGIRR